MAHYYIVYIYQITKDLSLQKGELQMSYKKKGNKGNSSYSDMLVTEPELSDQAGARQYTAEYKLNILKEAEALSHPGELGALLRREGLFSSHLATWYWQREKGELLESDRKKNKHEDNIQDIVKKRIDKLEMEFYREAEKIKITLEKRINKLERENKELKIDMEKASIIIDTQKKIIVKLRASLTDKLSETTYRNALRQDYV